MKTIEETVRNSVYNSVSDRFWDSVGEAVRMLYVGKPILGFSIRDYYVKDSVCDFVQGSVCDPVWDFVQISIEDCVYEFTKEKTK